MKPIEKFPHDDDNMRFDGQANMYFLTEQCLLNMGIDIRTRLASRKAMSPELLINRLLETVSEQIYGFIHEHSANNAAQDRILAECPSARSIILQAMKRQAIHVLYVGDLYNSVKPEERAAAIDEIAKQILGKPIVEIGRSILYVGGY